MSSIKLDAEWQVIWQGLAQQPKPVINDYLDLRHSANTIMKKSGAALQVPKDVQESKHTIKSIDGADFDVHRFVPALASAASALQRAILYAFGGGMVGGTVDAWRPLIQILAHQTSTQVFAVSYRLAPENPAPASVEDFYSAAKWLQLHAAEFNVDPKRIVLQGGSAGGGIVAGAALMARDRGLPYPLAAMTLCSPMLDDRTYLPDDHPIRPYLPWPVHANDVSWDALLGRKREERTDENVSIYAAPGRAKDLSGLPDTFIDVGGLDVFRNEDTEFARRLADAGIFVEFHLYPGIPHGFELLRTTQVAQRAISSQVAFVMRY
ncbi:Alpha/Beta hydrolase protein [Xylaria nigripes]|nr:Alpha/Beta hydrolase protein [Xylaria nigripes]